MKKQVVRVVVDIRDSRRDYFLPRAYAEKAFDECRIGQVWVGGSRWVYEDPNSVHKRHAVKA